MVNFKESLLYSDYVNGFNQVHSPLFPNIISDNIDYSPDNIAYVEGMSNVKIFKGTPLKVSFIQFTRFNVDKKNIDFSKFKISNNTHRVPFEAILNFKKINIENTTQKMINYVPPAKLYSTTIKEYDFSEYKKQKISFIFSNQMNSIIVPEKIINKFKVFKDVPTYHKISAKDKISYITKTFKISNYLTTSPVLANKKEVFSITKISSIVYKKDISIIKSKLDVFGEIGKKLELFYSMKESAFVQTPLNPFDIPFKIKRTFFNTKEFNLKNISGSFLINRQFFEMKIQGKIINKKIYAKTNLDLKSNGVQIKRTKLRLF